jgi:hypothetical protein
MKKHLKATHMLLMRMRTLQCWNGLVYTEGGAREEEGMANEGVIVVGFSSSIPRKDEIGTATTTNSPA